MIKKYRQLIIVFLVGLFISATLSIALADLTNASSSWTNYICNGKRYDQIAYCSCETFDGSMTGAAQINSTGNNYTAVGDIGARGRLYKQNGDLCKLGTWEYNPSSGYNIGYEACTDDYTNAVVDDYYYGKGLTRAYNGNGYDQHETTSTRMLICENINE